MIFTLVTASGSADISVTGRVADSTLAALIEAVDPSSVSAYAEVDGRLVPSSTLLADARLIDGSVLTTLVGNDGQSAAHMLNDDPPAEIVQVAGIGSGARARLAVGTLTVGPSARPAATNLHNGHVRDRLINLHVNANGTVTASGRATVDGEPVDGSAWNGGVLFVEGRAFRLLPKSAHALPGRGVLVSASRFAFNRQPRRPPDDVPLPIDVPEGGKQAREPRKFPLLAMIAPIPVSIVMAIVMDRWMFMLFSLMSPVMAFANWIEDRRSRKREVAEAEVADDEATRDFRVNLAEQRLAEIARRRRFDPDVGELIERAIKRKPDLWEVRPADADAFRFTLGLANLDFQPELNRPANALTQADDIVRQTGRLDSVPVAADLVDERGVCFVGPREFALDACRAAMISLSTRHGPADINIVVVSDDATAADWEWAKWLPHVRGDEGPRVFSDPEAVTEWANAVAREWKTPNRAERPSQLTIVVADGESWWRDRTAPLRAIFADPTMPFRLLTMTAATEVAPALCTTLLEFKHDGSAWAHFVNHRLITADVTPSCVAEVIATETARALAPLEDPEVPVRDNDQVPDRVSILDAIGIENLGAFGPEGFIQRWTQNRALTSPRTPLGESPSGGFEIDMVADGPHGLVAGTTGSGKSELLKSFIAGMAANHEPDRVNFVLVDFKGGAAFDVCAELPHTVGLVTDLDEHLTARVLRCLKAELTYREHFLRDAGFTSLDDYAAEPHLPPLPRLILIVDEFAALAAEFPDFLPSLVDVAQRGRSLGFHMILATQRPAGVVDNKIKANTNLRIALRVQDDGDSMDVIDTKDAAHLPRSLPGRAYVRLGAGELTAVQTAYSMSVTPDGEARTWSAAPFAAVRPPTPMERRLLTQEESRAVDMGEESDLARLVEMMRDAAGRLDQFNQRQPYPDPLPERLPVTDLHTAVGAPIGLVDLPDEQTQKPLGFEPNRCQSMLWIGIPGAGTSTTLTTIAASTAMTYTPDQVHMYVIDADTNMQAPLRFLPHVGAVIRADESERISRLIRFLRMEIERRRGLVARNGPEAVASEPTVIVFIDNCGALRDALSATRETDEYWSQLERCLREGPGLGVMSVLSVAQERGIPNSLSTQIPSKYAMKLANPSDYVAFGMRRGSVPTFVPGRAVDTETHTEIQIAQISEPIEELGRRLASTMPVSRPPQKLDPLPAFVHIADVVHASEVSSGTLQPAVGLAVDSGEPITLNVPWGEDAFVVGANGTGRSSTLAAIARGAHIASERAGLDLRIFAVSPRESPVSMLGGLIPGIDIPTHPSDVRNWVDRIEETTGHALVLVDDADRMQGPSLDKLAAISNEQMIRVIAGRPSELKTAHWSRPMQKYRNGVLLRPKSEDGEIFRISLGFRLPTFAPHRGLVANDGELSMFLAAISERPGAAAT